MSEKSEPVIGMVIFSLANDIVWVSWPDTENEAVALGPHDDVLFMMRDFLAQCDLGECLAGSTARNF
jgi:hypothetical protein